MSKTILLILLSFYAHLTFSQIYIKGKVVDGESQTPLKGASVYINNSTRGTTTNENGEFQLGPIESGRYEVVASFVGYEPILYPADMRTSTYRITFQLEKKGTVLSEVLVLTPELRRQYLEILKKNVLGFTASADRCRIRNIGEIEFVSGKTKDDIVAYTENELVIDNPDLGYIIYFELVDFYYNKSTSSTYFFGYTRFVDQATEDQSKKKFLRKRRQVYEGSTMHFFRSLLNDRLESDGFTVYQLLKRQRNNDSLEVEVIGQSKQRNVTMTTKVNADSMIQLYSDSIYKVYELKIGDGWRINYKNNSDLKLQITKRALGGFQPPVGTLCGLRLREAPVLINEKGTLLTPVRLYYDGIWVFERLANMLPEDYVYDK